MTELSDVQRAVMRYHGGKWTLAPWLISFFPPHRVYVEPFGGSAAVLLRKPPVHSEVYNDLDAEVVNVFRCLRDPLLAERLCQQVHLTPYARAEFNEAYQPATDQVERARRTIARSYMGFGSASVNAKHKTGFRSGSRRSGTPPAADWYNWSSHVRTFCERMRRVVIEERPALQVIKQQDGEDTLFYVDPPYPTVTRGSNRGVRQKYAYEMSDDDHRELAAGLHAAQGMVVLSGYPCELYDRELYASWRRVEREHYADGARTRIEVLWLNPACVAALDKARAQGTLLEPVE